MTQNVLFSFAVNPIKKIFFLKKLRSTNLQPPYRIIFRRDIMNTTQEFATIILHSYM